MSTNVINENRKEGGFVNPQVYERNGESFIPLAKLAEAINVEKIHIYNIGARLPKSMREYITSIKIENGSNKKLWHKSVNVKAIPFMLNKCGDKVAPCYRKSMIKFIDELVEKSVVTATVDSTSESNVVSFESTSLISNSEEASNVDSQKSLSVVETQPQEVQNVQENADLVSSSNDATDVLALLDGISSIISEHKELKMENSRLQEQVTELTSLNNSLQSELSNSSSLEELNNLKIENEKLKEEMVTLKSINDAIKIRTNQIKDYISLNNPQNN